MNRYNLKVPTEFGPDTRFDLRPAPAAPFRVTEENELERLKHTLLRKALSALRSILPNSERFLHTDARFVQWQLDAPFVLDVEQFDQHSDVVQ